ncbi:Phosphoenolpyruvate-protein phosphotransferase [Limihaloglobus sulfuriphilus]|uniref:Phosphoenolpyruvate-protein phosphotransferase n=1 Tax=Limihaloglobus sulfuriphilus TaxID=1851148 RepID=A0A1R7T5V1_9BACT|nr:phosphoenolpyruvate--protein phosphotransferase [Limihaloglobus sulfuriphilus]AQQ71823.1 Phosphoenolpyruvate-protein phosphotransferase [Limihaloglobus sulfuriphilus]
MYSNKIKNYELSGYSISSGVGIGKAHIYRNVLQDMQDIYCIDANEVEKEYQRIKEAFDNVRGRLQKNQKEVERKLNSDFAAILSSHTKILSDSSLHQEIYETIKRSCVNAELVVLAVFRRLEARIRHAEDCRLAQRADDIADLARQVLRTLTGQASHRLADLPDNTIVVASELFPSDTVFFSRKAVSGVIVERGGPASHAAILTRELGIPAVSNIDNAVQKITQGENLIVDGTQGSVLIDPDEEMQRKFQKKQEDMSVRFAIAKQYSHEKAATLDGTEVEVTANISCREDAELAVKHGADGIGLYRTEQLYFGREDIPGEDELLETLQETLAPINTNIPVTLRLLDIGGDKLLPFLNHTNISEPLMGQRGVRFLLNFPDLLITQLRSFLRLSLSRSVRILVPMVTLESDMQAVRKFYEEAANDLSCHQPPLGSMIETPAAALCAETISKYSDFLSVGTNDLTQYTMAASRDDAEVADYFIHEHPSIFYLLRCVAKAADKKPIGVCGQLAGEANAVKRLLAMGFQELSVNPFQVPYIKQAVQDIYM